jgi:hypothetical protein
MTDVTDNTLRARAMSVYAIVDEIRPLLGGRDASVQGAVLAVLLAYWIAGHMPPIREDVLKDHIDAVRGMVPAVLERVAEEARLVGHDA